MYMSASTGLRERWHTHECSMHVPHLQVQCMDMLQVGIYEDHKFSSDNSDTL